MNIKKEKKFTRKNNWSRPQFKNKTIGNFTTSQNFQDINKENKFVGKNNQFKLQFKNKTVGDCFAYSKLGHTTKDGDCFVCDKLDHFVKDFKNRKEKL